MIMVDELVKWSHAKHPFLDGSCHLTCDGPLEELHECAGKIGLRRAWFQSHSRHPHYDLTPARRAAALVAGAVFVPAKEQARRRLDRARYAARHVPTSSTS